MDLLCMGGNDWWYHNRDHMDVQMAKEFAKSSNVLFINSIVMQKPRIGQGKKFINKVIRKVRSILRGLKNSGQGFWVYSPLSLPVHHIPWLRPLNTIILRGQLWLATHKLGIRNPIVWVACPAACDTALKLKKRCMVYQRTDRFEAYPNVNPNVIMQYDRKLKANADLVIFVNHKLYETERKECKKAILLEHGVDYEMFATAENKQAKPSDIRDIPGPIAGYFGSIDSHSFDTAFLEKVVDLLPQMSFVLIGAVSADVAGLQKRENVWLLGQKPYEQIPHYGKCFSVAIMPLPQNQWIEAINPIKLKNYLALGKPVVSTPFPELQHYPNLVCVAKTPQEFAECVEKALVEDNPGLRKKRRERVAQASWDSKAQLVLRELFKENHI